MKRDDSPLMEEFEADDAPSSATRTQAIPPPLNSKLPATGAKPSSLDDAPRTAAIYTPISGEGSSPGRSNGSAKTRTDASDSGTESGPSATSAEPLGQVGKYQLERLLGKGGMAEVYLARQAGPHGFNKTVVIKRIRRGYADAEQFVEMFTREAILAAKLNHVNCVQIFEFGNEAGEYYIAMEYLKGISLLDAARTTWGSNTSFPVEVALVVIADAARGLHHAHTLVDDEGNRTPLIHRDVSPDNLFITRDGITKVLDFGIAKRQGSAEETTRVGTLKGKIPFMAPEVLRGESVDGRSDLWALGVTLYWLLTGERPFKGQVESMIIDAILREAPVPPRELNPLVPKSVEAVTLALLQKDPTLRPGTGEHLATVIEHILGSQAKRASVARFAQQRIKQMSRDQALSPQARTVAAAQPSTEWDEQQRGTDPSVVLEMLRSARQAFEPQSGVHEIEQAKTGAIGDSTAFFPVGGTSSSSKPRTGTGAGEQQVATGTAATPLWKIGVVSGAPAVLLVVMLQVLRVGSTSTTPTDLRPGGTSQPVATQPVAAQPTTTQPTTAQPTTAQPTTTQPTTAQPTTAQPTTAQPTTAQPTTTQPVTTASVDPHRGEAPAGRPDKPDGGKASGGDKSKPPRDDGKTSSGASQSTALADVEVIVVADARIRWELPSGRDLGTGATTLRLPANSDVIFAVDPALASRVRVPLNGRRFLKYDELPKGRFILRVNPWARVYIGPKLLGQTPIEPVSLPTGTYHLRLENDWMAKDMNVEVKAGEDAVLKVDMRKADDASPPPAKE